MELVLAVSAAGELALRALSALELELLLDDELAVEVLDELEFAFYERQPDFRLISGAKYNKSSTTR
jgi:hypothetical protein